MVPISITYRGDLRCEAVHGPSSTRLITDAPVDNHGKGESFSPTDLVATALGSCMTTIMGIAARAEGVKLDGARIDVEKHMATTPPRRVGRLVVRFTMPAGIPAAKRAKLEHAARTCPVVFSLNPEITVEESFSYPD
ncbi:MAG: OsmC family protein [Planctomycetota bacterium]